MRARRDERPGGIRLGRLELAGAIALEQQHLVREHAVRGEGRADLLGDGAEILAHHQTAVAMALEREDAEESLRERIANAKEAAKERALQAKAEAQERKLTLAADRCEAMKEKLVAVVPRLGNGVTSVKTSLDKNYDRIVAVHESGKLDTPDYDTLVSAVDEAKTAAEASIALVDPSSITIDCDNKGLGTQLDDYRSVIKAARDDLKSYHKALVGLVSAMNASSAKDEETTDESN